MYIVLLSEMFLYIADYFFPFTAGLIFLLFSSNSINSFYPRIISHICHHIYGIIKVQLKKEILEDPNENIMLLNNSYYHNFVHLIAQINFLITNIEKICKYLSYFNTICHVSESLISSTS